MSLNADQTVEALRAAGEPTRLRVLSLLAGEELSVMELSRILDQSQPRVSRHLKLMADAGLIERFPDGARVFYRLSSDVPARRLIDTVLDLLDVSAGAADDQRLEAVRREREASGTVSAPCMSVRAPSRPPSSGQPVTGPLSGSSTWGPVRVGC
jgi:ArsR family transcriptional regulator